MAPFVKEVVDQGIDVQVIAYARNPRNWLPSAYVQWGIRHKHYEGPIQKYETLARVLVNWYRGLIEWSDSIGNILTIRHYDTVDDVVIDFSQAAGVELVSANQRKYERGDDTEILLRALFNNHFHQPVLPSTFNQTVAGKNNKYPTIEASISQFFDYDATDQIIKENKELFDHFRDRCGIDLLETMPILPKKPSAEELRNRMLDYLVEITISQAMRVNILEKEVVKIKTILSSGDKLRD